jgi:7,8-didemethyl-8-hydroxy-5-deazariboflavin synthase CofG subunit
MPSDDERERVLSRAAAGPISDQDAWVLARHAEALHGALCEAARARRARAFGSTLSFSPKVFLPLTNLCRDFCDYCSFRRSPGDPGAWTMLPQELEDWLARGREAGAIEALFCLGDRPESVFPSYRALLRELGHESTVDYLVVACERALAHGLLPHTNAGLLTRPELTRLRPRNASMGLMLENVSPRLCARGMPHQRARDKAPELRLAMLRSAGELRIPFTTGILLGIGETLEERVESLLAIRAQHLEFGHVQEVIVQSYRQGPLVARGRSLQEPGERELCSAIALARLILPDEVSVQAPPNLSPGAIRALIRAGIDDFGGISALTPDYINPGHRWPELQRLAEQCAAAGFTLAPRLPVADRFARDPRFVDACLMPALAAAARRRASFVGAGASAPALAEAQA